MHSLKRVRTNMCQYMPLGHVLGHVFGHGYMRVYMRPETLLVTRVDPRDLGA